MSTFMRLTEPPSKAELESWKAVAGKCICNSVTFGAFDDMACFPANAIGKLVAAYELVAVIDETNREMAAIQDTMSNFMAELISKALLQSDDDEEDEEESE